MSIQCLISKFYKLPQLLILKSIAICNCLFWTSVCIGWSIHNRPHTMWYNQSHNFHPSRLICMYISARQNMLANQICVFITHKSCSIVGELASSSMESTIGSKLLKLISNCILNMFEIRQKFCVENISLMPKSHYAERAQIVHSSCLGDHSW